MDNEEASESEDVDPYAPPPVSRQESSPTYPKDNSVFAEPWMRDNYAGDPLDPALQNVPMIPAKVDPEHSAWDEPGVSPQLSGDTPDDAVTWYRHYLERRDETASEQSWMVMLGIAAASGFFAVFGTLFGGSQSAIGIVSVALLGPTMEEVMKVALLAWVVEKRPWLVQEAPQILITAIASGAVFAAVENALYLLWYIADPSQELILWRWSVCVALHVGCTTIAGIGIVRMWRQFQVDERPPALSDAAPYLVAAIVIHGLYNFCCVIAESLGLLF